MTDDKWQMTDGEGVKQWTEWTRWTEWLGDASMGHVRDGNPYGLASEAALHGWRPLFS
jgi:hypothetical protein